MTDLQLSIDWLTTDEKDVLLRDTSGYLTVNVAGTNLTTHFDIWSKKVCESVLVSAYPLASWLVNSWWRLHYEPLSKPGIKPSHDWRMAHELGAANHGYVWPALLFSPDGEAMNIWAEALVQENQSVSYLAALRGAKSVALADFSRELDTFISAVIERQTAMGHRSTDLSALWTLLQDERADAETANMRKLEARLGYDAESCPDDLLRRIMHFGQVTGNAAMDELAPVLGREDEAHVLTAIDNLIDLKGIEGKPEIEPFGIGPCCPQLAPWHQGVKAAKALRRQMGNIEKPVADGDLYTLLGLTSGAVNGYDVNRRCAVSVARPAGNGAFEYLPRKRHPDARRFEFARFLGGYCMGSSESPGWLVSSELTTARQKRQRAFAAEFLCPGESLTGFLAGDLSENAIEDASDYFGVSEQTVTSVLQNNGYLENPRECDLPYRLVC